MKFPISDLRRVSPFKDVFPINAEIVKRLSEDIKKNGYADESPVAVWEGHKLTVLDGFTRLAAAEMAGLVDVPIVYRKFADEKEALAYVKHCQRDRRNLTDADILRFVAETDKRMTKSQAGNRKGKLAPNGASSMAGEKTAAKTAESIGVSTRTVERVRQVLDNAAPEVIEQVKAGEMSINRAYEKTRQSQKEANDADYDDHAARKNHCQKIDEQAVNSLVKFCGLVIETAEAVVSAISSGKITNVEINY